MMDKELTSWEHSGARNKAGLAGAAIEILTPARQSAPIVFSSPHSGREYPADFVESSALDLLTLRKSEDSFVDEIFGAVPRWGAPLLKALFPRAYVDPNREPFELDPAMFTTSLPSHVKTRSPRILAGLGTIARIVANGKSIYRRKLTYAEAVRRIDNLYMPYHIALDDLVQGTNDLFGMCVVIDCHSMPSTAAATAGPFSQTPVSVMGGSAGDGAGRRQRADIVLGDGHGSTCSPFLTAMVEEYLTGLGYVVTRNSPYAGGYITRKFGQPARQCHALQIEINRGLYMDEAAFERSSGMADIAEHMTGLAALLCDLRTDALAA